ncbi:hypothetical protein FW774_13245 [Pedobacter sp. BS3]|uniref:hypothetical protein n=1 Tax=Pedobacter sp. BS3 TaxID=2567937 RepID=UPI0011EC1020|nr:hypothetical protein [Pedobacter sp. BS3]TZF83248.1 hypothetical protein FW774_13245 [Pedobacter sp. BS3]
MYDFVKIRISEKDFAKNLQNNGLLEFTTAVNEKTGELKDGVYTAEYKDLKFTIYPSGTAEIKGSLHKYWNNGEHNYNDFHLSDIKDVINDLSQTFGINPNTARLENLEIGLNVSPAFNPDAFLNSLIAYKNTPFSTMKVKGQGKGKEAYLNQYGIKIYNKGLQYRQPDNILRFEKKITIMDCLKKGHVYLADLTKPEFAEHGLRQLWESYNEVILKEPVNKSQLTKPQLRVYDLALTFGSWQEMTRKQRYDNRRKYTEIIQQFGTLKLHETVRELLIKKGNVLSGISKKDTAKNSNVLSRISNEKRKRFERSVIVSKRYFIPPVETPEKRACQSCGKDISHQSKKSKFCSAKYVGYEQAHKCRNTNSNPRNNFARKLKRLELNGLLFDVKPYMYTK